MAIKTESVKSKQVQLIFLTLVYKLFIYKTHTHTHLNMMHLQDVGQELGCFSR